MRLTLNGIDMLGTIILVLLGIVMLMFLNIFIGIALAFYNRKCPYCGKRMKHMRDNYDQRGHVEEYNFHCPHCGAWEKVTPMEMIREQHQN